MFWSVGGAPSQGTEHYRSHRLDDGPVNGATVSGSSGRRLRDPRLTTSASSACSSNSTREPRRRSPRRAVHHHVGFHFRRERPHIAQRRRARSRRATPPRDALNSTVSKHRREQRGVVDDALPRARAAAAPAATVGPGPLRVPRRSPARKAHQTNIAERPPRRIVHWASPGFAIATGDKIFTYVYLDPAICPTEIMLSFTATTGSTAAYWAPTR